MARKHGGLGRGLDALIPMRKEVEKAMESAESEGVEILFADDEEADLPVQEEKKDVTLPQETLPEEKQEKKEIVSRETQEIAPEEKKDTVTVRISEVEPNRKQPRNKHMPTYRESSNRASRDGSISSIRLRVPGEIIRS